PGQARQRTASRGCGWVPTAYWTVSISARMARRIGSGRAGQATATRARSGSVGKISGIGLVKARSGRSWLFTEVQGRAYTCGVPAADCKSAIPGSNPGGASSSQLVASGLNQPQNLCAVDTYVVVFDGVFLRGC